jgi:inhibitor of KinA sporulation pathway (predicted exonuclease)
MKYFFDTEFIEDGHTIDLISIGMVCDDGRELYMVSSEFDESKADDWVRKHVLNHIPRDIRRYTRREIAAAVNAFTLEPLVRYFAQAPAKNKKAMRPQMWAYFADYDWVVLCQLYGRMKDLPDHLPQYCRDLKQFADDLGNPQLPNQKGTNHHALDDARWAKEAWDYLHELRIHNANRL